MGRQSIIASATSRRARRLSLFCREVKRILYSRCLDDNVSTKEIDFFIEDLFGLMRADSAAEYSLETLIGMTLKQEFHDYALKRYMTYLH